MAALLYGGVTVLVSVLHPEDKHDSKGVPVALFAVATVVIGIAIITYLQRPKRQPLHWGPAHRPRAGRACSSGAAAARILARSPSSGG